MKKIILAFSLALIIHNIASANSPKKALIYLVDQKAGLPKIGGLDFNKVFDQLRVCYLSSFNNQLDYGCQNFDQCYVPVYEKVYLAMGEQVRDDEYMKNLWNEAMNDEEIDVVDYFALVHHSQGQPWFKPQWEVRNNGKLRFVYSSGCCSGNGGEEIIAQYGALAAVGHKYDSQAMPSASPFWSFRVLDSWINGKSFNETIFQAWQEGKTNITSVWAKPFLKAFKYQNAKEAIEASKLEYSYRKDLDPKKLTIHSDIANFDEEVIEYCQGSVE